MAQVVDDSTQNVYGPKTTLYVTEEDVLNNVTDYKVLDTTLNSFHRWDPVEADNYYWQYLGTVGTAMQPIYYQAPTITGKRSGFNVYDEFARTSDEFRYFDTKSPYTNLSSIFGGNYRAYLGIDFSRNVNPYWNVGFSFNRWTIDKQIGPATSRGDLNVLSHSYDIYTDYRTKNNKFRLLANFARTFHNSYETGGIADTATVVDYDELFDYEDEDINLRNVQSSELTQHYHTYAQYELDKLISFYHQFDWQRELNQFASPADRTAQSSTNDITDLLGEPLIRTDSTVDLATTYQINNVLGMKGNLGAIFYRVYVKNRILRFTSKYLPEVNRTNESYGGAYMAFEPVENWQLSANAEYQLGGNYKIKAELKTPYLKASALSMQFDAPFFYQRYFGNFDYWSNNFESEQVQQLEGMAFLDFKDWISIRPKAKLVIVNRHMYFNQDAEPEQTADVATMLHPGVEMDFRLGNFFINVNYINTIIEGGAANVFRMPEHFANFSFYYERPIVGELIGRVGIDTHIQSAYFADDYDPVTQQFFLQDNFEIPAYGFGDIYLSFKINSAKLFFKYRHINQGLTARGYFTTPYYTGQQAVFDLGLNWSFYN